jgi:ornithine cyclodeaminase/alanine dehydrogenase
MTLVLSRTDVAGLLEPAEVIAAVEQAHADLARRQAVLASPHGVRLDGGDTGFIPMTAVSARHELASVKLLVDMPSNRQLNLSAQRSTIMLVSAATGECEAILDGRDPTLLRTAAASAVATKHLARTDSKILGLVGAGALALEHLRALRVVRDVTTVLVWSRSRGTLERFLDQASVEGVELIAAESVVDVVSGADVVCTLTPGREPIVEGRWLTPGTHVNVVGAPPRPDHREMDSAGMSRATVVVDSRLTVQETGDLVIPLREGALSPQDLEVELGQVVAGLRPGRTGPEQITLFKSVGIGLQDLAICQLLLERARAAGRGRDIDLTA